MERWTYWINFNRILQPAVFLVTEVVVVVSCDGGVLHAISNLSKTNFSAWNNEIISAEDSTSSLVLSDTKMASSTVRYFVTC
jgi:hypothetical protein